MCCEIDMRRVLCAPLVHQQYTVVTRRQWDEMYEYSTTLPTAPKIGFRWKRQFRDGGWMIGEAVADPQGQPGFIGIRWTYPEIIDQ